MARPDRRERKLVVIELSHRGPRRFSGESGVFPEETDEPSILFPCRTQEVPLCFQCLRVPGRDLASFMSARLTRIIADPRMCGVAWCSRVAHAGCDRPAVSCGR